MSLPTPISGVEAQLLQESAAAQLHQPPDSSTIALPPRSGPEKITQAATDPIRKRDLGDDIVDKYEEESTVARVGSLQHGELLSGTLVEPSMEPGNAGAEDEHEGDEGVSILMDIDKPEGATTENEGFTNVGLSRESRAVVPSDPAGVLAVDKTSTSELSAKPRPSSLSFTPVEPSGPVLANRDGSRATRDEETDLEAPPTQLKLHTSRTRDRRRRSTPTVIFGKQPKKPKPSEDGTVAVGQQQSGHIPSDDYFTPLFIEGFTRQSTWMKPIEKLINQAHKTISTSDQYISMLDHQACKILRRVYHLQQHDKWSLRQPVRCSEPTRPASHWDVLLQEMKWMRTDFREEGKWKRTVARNLAHACAEWVHSDRAERLMLQVNAVIPPRPAEVEVKGANLGRSEAADETLPDLVHTDSPTENEDELPEILIDCIAPSAIFALPDDEVVFGLQPSKTADLLLENLPLHGSPLTVPKFDVSDTDYDPDAKWKRPAVPLSKYVEGEMVLASNGPPRKRRRYDYLAEDDDDDNDDEVIFGHEPDNSGELQAENSAVALFSPEMKGIRDRLHAGHQFRPPSEHAMPPQSFFESRTASQWTWAEDEQLKSLVRECSYNWSLISAMASTVSAFASGAERRTPWECFERWVSLGSLDGLPNDMARTPYFKAYQARIDAAQRAIAQQNQNAQQQVGPNGAVTPIPRRRPTTSIRVERRRNQKHLALIDAMRKLAKKREATAQKAQQAANLAAMRKANEVPRQQIQNKTPRDYSIMRWERDQALAERMAAYAIRQADANARRLVSTF
jgi:chromatin modification-related protein VID21